MTGKYNFGLSKLLVMGTIDKLVSELKNGEVVLRDFNRNISSISDDFEKESYTITFTRKKPDDPNG